MSSATERLHAMLDERGVEYKDRNVFGKHVFHWGKPFHGAMFTDSGEWTELVVENATPEQAVEATLGGGTCHAIISDNLTESEGMGDAWADCSECGHLLFVLTDPNSEPPNFCPNCGRKVVDA